MSGVVSPLLALVLGLAAPANAAPVLWTGAPSTDSIDWGQLGTANTPGGTPVPDASTATSLLGLVATVSNLDPAAELARFDQVPPAVDASWSGNFFGGTKVLYSFFDVTGAPSAGPIEIDFDSPVMAAGVKIQSAEFGSFTAFIDVFEGPTLLGSLSRAGLSNNAGDGSAIFIGALSDAINIDRIRLRVVHSPDVGDDSFAIGPVLLFIPTEVPPSPRVPAPASMALVAAGVLGSWLIAARRRSRR